MDESVREEYPHFEMLSQALPLGTLIGAPLAIITAVVYGLPTHAILSLVIVGLAVGFGITVGFHRLFTHRSFATSRGLERLLLILGCMAGQSSPIFWISTHRKHHQHTDEEGDPHSPYVDGTRRLGLLRGFWHAHVGWTWERPGYDPTRVNDLRQRPDLVWIDRYWYVWYLVGLALPAAIGGIVGGTAYDALIGFLWGGLLRHAVTLNTAFAVNSVSHVWGSRPFPTGDQSRNNLLVGVLALGEGWHNNHHAFPYSARHGLHWWQVDPTWWLIWLMERVGLVWRVRRPKRRAAALSPPQPSAV